MTAPGRAPAAVAAPPPVRLAARLVLARIALTVAGLVLAVAYRDETLAVVEASAGGADDGLARTFAGLGLAVSVVLGLLTIAVWVVLAVFTAKGHGWARIVLTVLAGLALLSALFTVGGVAVNAVAGLPQVLPVPVTLAQVVVGLALWVVTLVLLWRPASSAYFAASAAARARA